MGGQATRREAIVEAMMRVVGEKGYPAASVADVLAAAGVSRTTFYKHFADKQECFLAAFDLAAERIAVAASSGCNEAQPWRGRVQAGLAAVVDLLAAEPGLGRLAIVEAATAGVDARQRQHSLLDRLAGLLESRRGEKHPPLPPHTGLMAVGAVAGLLFDALRGDPPVDLAALMPELEFALLVPFLGPRAAAEPQPASASVASA